MALKNKRKYIINSVDRAIRILFLLGENHEPMRLSELSRRLNIDKSTAYRIMATLLSQGFVEQDAETRRYFLGLRLLELSAEKLRSLRVLPAAKPVMRDLMIRTNETVHLGVLVDGEVLFLDSEQGPGVLSVNTIIGSKAFPHSSAVGKALLANLSTREIDAILALKGMPRFTGRTLLTPEELHKELASVRELGYAIDDEETFVGVRCVAVPIFNDSGDVVAAMGISGPAQRITPELIRVLASLVKDAGTEISRQLGYVDRKAAIGSPSSLQISAPLVRETSKTNQPA
jgi:DNA-binding IclR family transcriptional regulator